MDDKKTVGDLKKAIADLPDDRILGILSDNYWSYVRSFDTAVADNHTLFMIQDTEE